MLTFHYNRYSLRQIVFIFQVTAGKRKVVYIGITCGLSAPYVAGQLDYCMDNLDVFTPVVIGFNPTYLARYVSQSCLSVIIDCMKYHVNALHMSS